MKGPKFLQKTAFRYALAGIACSVMAFLGWKVGVPVYHEFQDSFAMKEFKEYGVFGTYKRHFFSFVDHVDEFANLEQENEELSEKLALLEKEKIQLESKNAERDLASLNETLEENLKNDAGSELATALNTIHYEVPGHLSSTQLYSLALGYFKKEDYEKSAMLFHHLLSLKDDAQFRRPENYLLSGISWFQLKNFHLAQREIKEAKFLSVPSDSTHRSSMIWEAIIQKALGKQSLAQKSLLQFLESYPHSTEASVINGTRVPAGKETQEAPFRPFSEKHKNDEEESDDEQSAKPHHPVKTSEHKEQGHRNHEE